MSSRPKLPLTRPCPFKKKVEPTKKPMKTKDKSKKKDSPDQNNWTKEFTQEELNEFLK